MCWSICAKPAFGELQGERINQLVPISPSMSAEDEERATIGDWLLLDRESLRIQRLVKRLSLFKRRAPGTGRQVQLIAANVDTVFIVSSCNQDFNIARLEYLRWRPMGALHFLGKAQAFFIEAGRSPALHHFTDKATHLAHVSRHL